MENGANKPSQREGVSIRRGGSIGAPEMANPSRSGWVSPTLQTPVDDKTSHTAWDSMRDDINDAVVSRVSVDVMYQSYRLIALLSLCALLAWLNITSSNAATSPGGVSTAAQPAPGEGMVLTPELAVSIARGICVFVLVLGAFVFPTGPFIRPHPIVWKLVFGVAVLYEAALIALLSLPKPAARAAMTLVDPKLGVPLEPQSFAGDCSITPAILSSKIDRFVLAHFVGWVCKALFVRERLLLWHLSVFWELIELCLMHVLPNFQECWWDTWILDVLICNGIGIEVGIALCKYLEVRPYHWLRFGEYPTLCAKVNRTFLQFTPASWIRARWDTFRDAKRYMQVQTGAFVLLLTELNSFFLKSLLWIPSKSLLNLFRLIFFVVLGLPVTRQYYIVVSNPGYRRVPMHAWIYLLLVATESMLVFKLSRGEYESSNFTPEVARRVASCVALYVLTSLIGLAFASYGTQSNAPGGKFLIEKVKTR